MGTPTYNLLVGGYGLPANEMGKLCVIEKEIDFAEYNLESGQFLAALQVPKEDLLIGCAVKVIAPESAAATADIGLYAASNNSAIDADGIFAGLSLATAGKFWSGPVLAQSETTPFAVSIMPALWGGYIPSVDAYIGIAYKSGTLISEAKILVQGIFAKIS